MLNCVYHPVYAMRVVTDEERQALIESGVWFDTPTEAKQLRAKYDGRIQSEKSGKRKSKRTSEDV